MWKDSTVHTPSKILPGPMASMECIARAAEPFAPSGCRVCRVVKGDHRVMKNDGIWQWGRWANVGKGLRKFTLLIAPPLTTASRISFGLVSFQDPEY